MKKNRETMNAQIAQIQARITALKLAIASQIDTPADAIAQATQNLQKQAMTYRWPARKRKAK